MFSFSGFDVTDGAGDTELYYRDVAAVNATVVRDYESLVGVEVGDYGFPVEAAGRGLKSVGVMSPKAALGRGPGEAKDVLVRGGS